MGYALRPDGVGSVSHCISCFGANIGSFRSRGGEPIAILDCCFMVQARAEPNHLRVKFTEAGPMAKTDDGCRRPRELGIQEFLVRRIRARWPLRRGTHNADG